MPLFRCLHGITAFRVEIIHQDLVSRTLRFATGSLQDGHPETRFARMADCGVASHVWLLLFGYEPRRGVEHVACIDELACCDPGQVRRTDLKVPG